MDVTIYHSTEASPERAWMATITIPIKNRGKGAKDKPQATEQHMLTFTFGSTEQEARDKAAAHVAKHSRTAQIVETVEEEEIEAI